MPCRCMRRRKCDGRVRDLDAPFRHYGEARTRRARRQGQPLFERPGRIRADAQAAAARPAPGGLPALSCSCASTWASAISSTAGPAIIAARMQAFYAFLKIRQTAGGRHARSAAECAAGRSRRWCWSARGIAALAAAGVAGPRRRVDRGCLAPAGLAASRSPRINIDLCFPDAGCAARRRLVRDNLVATVTGALELLRAWYAPPDALAGPGADRAAWSACATALAADAGVLLFTGHFTHTELAMRLLVEALGQPIGGVVRRNNNPCLEATFDAGARDAFRRDAGKEGRARPVARACSRGRRWRISADQNFNYQHAFVPFFGVPAATLDHRARPGQARRRAWCCRCGCIATATASTTSTSTAPWPAGPELPPADAAALYMRELEARVREHPEQYLWVHRRFKTRPAGRGAVLLIDLDGVVGLALEAVDASTGIAPARAGSASSIAAITRAVSAVASSVGKSSSAGRISAV